MDQSTVLLIVWLSAAVILAIIVAVLIGYKFRLDYLKSKDNDELENSEEDINVIIAHVIDRELDRRLTELGLIQPLESSNNHDIVYEGTEHSRDKFRKLLRDINSELYYDDENEIDWR